MFVGLQCPECAAAVTPCSEQHEPDTPIERECQACGKTFLYQIQYLPTYSSWAAPCLNGEQHDYQPIRGWPEEHFARLRRCTHCLHEKTVATTAAPTPASVTS